MGEGSKRSHTALQYEDEPSSSEDYRKDGPSNSHMPRNYRQRVETPSVGSKLSRNVQLANAVHCTFGILVQLMSSAR